MSTLFADIRAAAAKGAANGAAAHAAPTDFDGTLTEPSPGYSIPVAPLTKNLYGYQQRAVETILTSRAFIDKAHLENLVGALGEKIRLVYLEDLRAQIGALDKLRA